MTGEGAQQKLRLMFTSLGRSVDAGRLSGEMHHGSPGSACEERMSGDSIRVLRASGYRSGPKAHMAGLEAGGKGRF